MAASSTDYFTKVGSPGTATTLAAPGHTIGGTSINVGSTSNWSTDTGVIFAIDTVSIVNGVEVRNVGSYTEWEGVVTSATTIGSMVVRYGSDQNYPAGATTRVYIPVASSKENRMVDGLLVSHNQDGTLQTIAANKVATASIQDSAVTTAKIADASITNAKLSTAAGEIGAAWQSWTPSLATGNFGTGSTVSGKYIKVGKRVDFIVAATVNSTSLNMDFSITPPVSPHATYATTFSNSPIGVARSFDLSAVQAFAGMTNLSSTITVSQYTSGTNGRADGYTNANPFAWATGDTIRITGSYEAA